jgi:AdoMet-dependent heme synthase
MDTSTPRVQLASLDTLWFQVSGTLCNLACTHCFVSCSPTNRTHEPLSLETVRRYLAEARGARRARSTTSPAASRS